MSIYATLWRLQFPRDGDAYLGCGWVEVVAQGVPAHIGTPTPGYGYEAGDPYEAFLHPALRVDSETPEDSLRAVVFVVSTTKKGTSRSGQEYESPLLVLTGPEYAAMALQTLHGSTFTQVEFVRDLLDALILDWHDTQPLRRVRQQVPHRIRRRRACQLAGDSIRNDNFTVEAAKQIGLVDQDQVM